jgi:hypothetical protein
MAGFLCWLVAREGRTSEHNARLTKLGDNYATSFHDPVVLTRTRKAMEAEDQAMQKMLGIKPVRRRGRLRK